MKKQTQARSPHSKKSDSAQSESNSAPVRNSTDAGSESVPIIPCRKKGSATALQPSQIDEAIIEILSAKNALSRDQLRRAVEEKLSMRVSSTKFRNAIWRLVGERLVGYNDKDEITFSPLIEAASRWTPKEHVILTISGERYLAVKRFMKLYNTTDFSAEVDYILSAVLTQPAMVERCIDSIIKYCDEQGLKQREHMRALIDKHPIYQGV